MSHRILSSARSSVALSFFLAAASGCSAAPSDLTSDESVASVGQEVEVQNPNGVYFASVTANGTGCPAGSWEANIDPAGETFTLTFSAYETSLAPTERLSVKDCQIGIKL
ncbi:DUF4360 domain-containing protein, partial [bacterium]